MKIAIIGGSGRAGREISAELARRDHQVTAISRHPENAVQDAGVTAIAGDVKDAAALSALLAGHDAVVSAVMFADTDPAALVGAVRASGVARYLVVGGAGSLEVSPGVQLMDTPAFPAAWQATAEGARQALKRLQQETQLDWTMLSPAAQLEPGARTGSFRLGGDKLLADAEGHSRISVQDYAVAMIDELERPAHSRRRFSVAY